MKKTTRQIFEQVTIRFSGAVRWLHGLGPDLASSWIAMRAQGAALSV